MNHPVIRRPEEEAPETALDRGVGLSQELNQAGSASGLLEKALSGTLRTASGPRPKIMEPEELLAIAIVRQAAEDWQSAVHALRRHPDHRPSLLLKQETERFFRSAWFQILMDLDGEVFLNRLRAEAKLPEREAPSETRRRAQNLHLRMARRRRRRQRRSGL